MSKAYRTTSLQVGNTTFLVFIGLLLFHITSAQERCGTVPYTKKLQEQNTLKENKHQFEEWLHRRITERKIALDTQEREAITYQVPVVVHVIHNGEAVGIGSNIPDEQILSQIRVLNDDFRRMNADADNTPAEFLPAAGALDIEFVLAKQTPQGLPTTGIVRVMGTKSQWTLNDNYELKSLSYWPAEDYLNIWVTTLASSFVGFAQFPVSGLPGLENSSNNRLTDGVVIHHDSFGSAEDGPFDLDPQYNRGRTTTHEMGHFFGLRHVWGDDESNSDKCAGTDYVDDTPNQALSTSGCPSGTRTSCGTNDMYMNFLDYTNDACMNLFTLGQINRMIAVLENSPRRASLLTSHALADPEPVANNLGIKSILSPGAKECGASMVPSLLLQNNGTNTVTSTRVRMIRNGVAVQTTDFNVNIDPLETATVSFAPQALAPGTISFTFEILLTNGSVDAIPNDNAASVDVTVPESIDVPFAEDFNGFPANWTVNNPDQQITWNVVTAPASLPSNQALKLNFYEYEDGKGEIDILSTPVFDLSGAPAAYVSFDVAHARFQNSQDRLRVYVFTGCDDNLFNGTIVYEKAGANLATALPTTVPFTPSGAGDWRTEIINLADYIGESSVQLAFLSVNDWGNNLYLDNISVITSAEEDLALKEVVAPAAVRCDNSVVPQLRVQNTGTVTINSFNINMRVNDGNLLIVPFTESLVPGAEVAVPVADVTLDTGPNTLSFELSDPNGKVDIDPSNNTAFVKTIVSDTQVPIPLRENFDAGLEGWTSVNPRSEMTWELVSTNFNQSVVFEGFNNPVQGDEAWLVSPALDFSAANSASIFFDISYAYDLQREDRLRILASTNCGETYSMTVFDAAGEDLAVATSSLHWKPTSGTGWVRKFVRLTDLAGLSGVRLAFVVTNANGNNIYLDNLEFFTSDDPDPKKVEAPFLVYGTDPSMPGSFYITFNLDDPQPVGYEVLDVTGRSLVNAEVGQVLNQTFQIDAGRVATGIYILRLRIGDRYYATRVFMQASP